MNMWPAINPQLQRTAEAFTSIDFCRRRGLYGRSTNFSLHPPLFPFKNCKQNCCTLHRFVTKHPQRHSPITVLGELGEWGIIELLTPTVCFSRYDSFIYDLFIPTLTGPPCSKITADNPVIVYPLRSSQYWNRTNYRILSAEKSIEKKRG